MTPEQFTYWLQGKLEGREVGTIPYNEWQEVKNHLQTVFKKETPNYQPHIKPLEQTPISTDTPKWNTPGSLIC